MSTHLKMAVAIAATESNREAINHDRRKLLAGAAMGLAAAGAASLFPIHSAPAATNDAIRPFRINVPEEALVDLRRRLAATRPRRRPSTMTPRAYPWRPSRNSCATGRPN